MYLYILVSDNTVMQIRKLLTLLQIAYLYAQGSYGNVEINGDEYIHMGADIRLECVEFDSAEGGIRWFRTHSFILQELTATSTNVQITETRNRRRKTFKSVLTISNSAMVDAGIYTCSNKRLTRQESMSVFLFSASVKAR